MPTSDRFRSDDGDNRSSFTGDLQNRSEAFALSGGLSGFSDLKHDLFGKKSKPASTYASDTFARLTRERWADYVKTFVPIENQLIDYATNPDTVNNAMSSASEDVSNAFGAQQGAMSRRLKGLGLSLNEDEQMASDRSSSLSRATADVQAQNLSRDMTISRQQQILGNPAPDVTRAGTAAMGA